MKVDAFKDAYKKKFEDMFAVPYTSGSTTEQFQALGQLLRSIYTDKWVHYNQGKLDSKQKQVFYFSMEFLPGRQLKRYLLNLDLLDTARTALEELGLDFEAVAAAEVDPALGNGGLGRLASCFMDSMAATGVPGNGCGIRYRYGLFKQKFIDGYQIELPENWLRNPNSWEVRKESKSVIVRFGGNVWLEPNKFGDLKPVYENTFDVLAVPYDTPQIGYRNDVVNNLRLFSAEIPPGHESYFTTPEQRKEIQEITEVLYPDDSNYEGRLLRLKQEYFMCSAGIQSIVRYFKTLGLPWSVFPDKVAIHINDTHPTLCIPELMRILVDEESLTWGQAWNIVKKSTSYTNHTILAEAMERWPIYMIEGLLPRIMQIIYEINRRHLVNKTALYGAELAHRTAPIDGDQVLMANLAIIASHSVNGVAKLHTEILEHYTLRDFKTIYPFRFNNKTNGVTHRRWVQLANEGLSKVLDQYIGDRWRFKPREMNILQAFRDSDEVLEQLQEVKLANKERFARFVKEEMKLDIDPTALFDVQIKRLHAYKRQLLQVMHIVDRYLTLKENPKADFAKRVFIFGAKAAPSYHYAKSVIKIINELANLVNNDPAIGDKIKIVFVENYGVSLAELIIPAANLSEQISLAGKEASGTSNMKLMANGALTMATLDGANVEIYDLVGDDNIFLFGMTADEVQQLREANNYYSRGIYEENPQIKRVLNAFIDGTIPNIEAEGREIFDSLVLYNDEYFLLQDYLSFYEAQMAADKLYQEPKEWAKRALTNIAYSGKFSSDYTILRYAESIWNVSPETNLLGEGFSNLD
ncbi:glycogen/starch/alpha-glucan phosphorylase [uncultured Abiotrophia sp.]|uniref:glycogen/starch/alpha-glucan phosphorylase n=1 Tax=uncultured Abiotrophia sp. TaxID=316094 RepID=UPI00261B3EA9|nr:glycogen/starch/alpha-glucan phosphorylase [uncultured Abiotrophia sp.]